MNLLPALARTKGELETFYVREFANVILEAFKGVADWFKGHDLGVGKGGGKLLCGLADVGSYVENPLWCVAPSKAFDVETKIDPVGHGVSKDTTPEESFGKFCDCGKTHGREWPLGYLVKGGGGSVNG